MISVIIPTYCPEEYIWKCLDSLQAQTLPKSEFEVVIVLNGCNEPYYCMLSDGLEDYTALQVNLLHTDVAGVSNARNIGLDAAKGEYIAFIDDDDWVTPSYLADMLSQIAGNSIVASNEIDFIEETAIESDSYITRAFRRCKPRGRVSLFTGRSLMSSACCKLIPRSVIAGKRFDVTFTLSEDSLFMTSLSSKVQTIILSDVDCIYYRRVRQTSASRRASQSARRRQTVRLVMANIRLYFSEIRHNNILFFASRVAAAMLKVVKKTWI